MVFWWSSPAVVAPVVETPENTTVKLEPATNLLIPLTARGAQDKALQELEDDAYDFKRSTLHNQIYNVQFDMVQGKPTFYNGTLSLVLSRSCDAINNLVLLIDNPKCLSLNDLLSSVRLEIGGNVVDSFYGDGIHEAIETVAALWNKQIRQIGATTFVPLPLAMLHDPNLLPLVALQYHEVKIQIALKEKNSTISSCRLWANNYVLDDLPRGRLAAKTADHQIVTSQVQIMGDKVGPGTARVNFYLNHPVTQLAFWGPQKDKLKRVCLKLNGKAIVDKTAEILEYEKQELLQVPCKAWVLFLSDKNYYERYHCGVNMSRIDHVELILETEQEETTDLHVVAVNLNIGRVSSGMFGLAYAS